LKRFNLGPKSSERQAYDPLFQAVIPAWREMRRTVERFKSACQDELKRRAQGLLPSMI
jgi:hypothetical protein